MLLLLFVENPSLLNAAKLRLPKSNKRKRRKMTSLNGQAIGDGANEDEHRQTSEKGGKKAKKIELAQY